MGGGAFILGDQGLKARVAVQGAQVGVLPRPRFGHLLLLQGDFQQAQGLFGIAAEGGEAGAVVFVFFFHQRAGAGQGFQRLGLAAQGKQYACDRSMEPAFSRRQFRRAAEGFQGLLPFAAQGVNQAQAFQG